MATMSGAMPGESTAAVCSVPCADVTSTTSPSRDAELRGRRRVDLDPAAPHRRRQRIGHLLQPRQVRRRAVEERRRGVRQEVERDTAARRRRTAAPTTTASAATARSARGAAASAAGSVPHQPPFSCASVHASESGEAARERRERGGQHLLEGLPRQVQRPAQEPRPTSSSTSGVARVSCSGFITGGATLATATIDPDSGTASAHDSRNE